MIDALMNVRGVRYAAIVTAAGQPMMFVGEEKPQLDVAMAARAMMGSLQNATGTSEWNDLLLDIDGGPVLVTPVGNEVLLTAFDDVASLGRVRFAVKRALGRV